MLVQFSIKGKTKNLKKAYILLITCSLSRAVHLEMVQSQKLENSLSVSNDF